MTYSLTGKFFVNQEQHGDHGIALVRGRILGPVAGSDLGGMPFYLCEIWPADEKSLSVRSQTIFALAQLVSAWLYDDEALFVEGWRKIQSDIRRAEDRARRAEAAERKRLVGGRVREVTLPDGRIVRIVDPRLANGDGNG